MPYVARVHQLRGSLLYHVYSRGQNREEIFHGPADYERFVDLLRQYRERFLVKIYHWVLMPNHYHLLLEIEEPWKLSSMMAGLGRSYTCYHHRTHKTCGYLWQGRFKMQPVQKEIYLTTCGRYIERNPVKAGMVREAAIYPYSSAAFYCLGKKDNLTSESPGFAQFGQRESIRRAAYQKFLQSWDASQELMFDNLEDPQGSVEFRRRLIRWKGHYLPRRDGSPRSSGFSVR